VIKIASYKQFLKSPKKEEFISLYESGKEVADIWIHFGISSFIFYKIVKILELPARLNLKVSERFREGMPDHKIFIKMWNGETNARSGTIKRIANHFEISTYMVQKVRKMLNLPYLLDTPARKLVEKRIVKLYLTGTNNLKIPLGTEQIGKIVGFCNEKIRKTLIKKRITIRPQYILYAGMVSFKKMKSKLYLRSVSSFSEPITKYTKLLTALSKRKKFNSQNLPCPYSSFAKGPIIDAVWVHVNVYVFKREVRKRYKTPIHLCLKYPTTPEFPKIHFKYNQDIILRKLSMSRILLEIKYRYVELKQSSKKISDDLNLDNGAVRTKLHSMKIIIRKQRHVKGGYACLWCSTIMERVRVNKGPRKQIYCCKKCRNKATQFRRIIKKQRKGNLSLIKSELKSIWGEKYSEVLKKIMNPNSFN